MIVQPTLTPGMLLFIIGLSAAVVICSVLIDILMSPEAVAERRAQREKNLWIQRGEKMRYKAKLQRNRHRKSY